MGTTSQSEHVLSEFFITASKVSEVAARGLQDALKDAPKCHFQILQKLQCIISKNGDTREVAVSDFVRYTGLSPQAVSRLLRVLEKEGLIERKADINDLYMWKGNRSKYNALINLVSLSPNNKILLEHEEYWRNNYPMRYEIFKLFFRERKTYEDIVEELDLPDTKVIQRECKSIYDILERPLGLPSIE